MDTDYEQMTLGERGLLLSYLNICRLIGKHCIIGDPIRLVDQSTERVLRVFACV